MTEARPNMLARAEAFPLPWKELTDDQRRIVKDAARLFGELAELSWEPRRRQGAFDKFLVRLDIDRHNHVALIEGKRGIGKTAVLLTLLYAWGAVERAEASRMGAGAPPEEVIRGRVVPVGLVDLQPLPPGTNLFVHLAGQLSRLVEAIEEHTATGPGRLEAWNPNRPAEAESRTRWRAFVEAAAAGWDGRLDARRASLDPEAFALEFEQAERHRLDIRERFRELADALVEEYPRTFTRRREPPFFVIPIDDADMNPGRVRELLDLVRTLWHPRVGFLLTGHDEVFLEALKEALSGGKERTTTIQDALARAIYDKAVPPYQRFRLRELPFAERMSVVSDTLRRTRIFEHPLRPAHLLDYMEVNRLAGTMLPGNMRALRDWESLVQRREFDLGLEDPRGRHGFVLDEIAGSLLAVLTGPGAGDLEVAGDVAASAGFDDYGGSVSRLSGEMMLVQDAQRLPLEERVRIPLGRTVAEEKMFVWPTPRWPFWLDHGAFVYLLRAAFRISAYEDIDGLNAHYRWRSVRSQASFSRNDAFRVFLTWLLRYLDFRLDRAKAASGTLREALDDLLRRHGDALLSWEQISTELDRIAEDPSYAAEERRWAGVRVALFAAPEHQLGPDVANMLLRRVKARHTAAELRDIVSELRGLRRTHAVHQRERGSTDKKNPPDMTDVLRQIDAQSSRYDWVLDISQQEGLQDEMLRRLSEFSTPAPTGGGKMLLSAYFDASRWATVLRNLSDDLRRRWMQRLSPLPRGGASAPLGAMVLWNDAIRAGVAHKLSPLVGDPQLTELRRRLETLGLGPWGFQDDGAALALGSLRLAPAHLAWSATTGFEDTLDGVLFEVVWDALADGSAGEADGAGFPAWWSPLGGLCDGQDRPFPWPCPAWPAFLDHKLFAESYNNEIRRIRHALASLPEGYDIASGVAHYYVQANLSLYFQRQISVEWEARPAAMLWDNLLTTAQLPNWKGRGPAMRTWLRRAPLLAAPESGLPPDTARAILDAWRDTPEERDFLRHERQARLRFMGINDEEAIIAELARIDDAYQGHPWIRLFGSVAGS